MIAWTEQKPDFYRRTISELCSQLPFMSACAVMLSEVYPQLIVKQATLDGIHSHLEEQNIEMGGLMLGAVHDLNISGDEFIIAIEDSVRATEFDGTGVSLRMDSNVWEKAREKAKGRLFVVGWYHSHPNLGVFFSGTDRVTQRNFFCHPYSVGLVIDPIRKEEKWFLGPESSELTSSLILKV